MPNNNGYKRPGYKACSKMVVGDARKALAIARRVRSYLNVEFKNHDIEAVSGTIPDGVGEITQLTNIPQGDTGITRDGANVKITSIYIRLLLGIHSSAIISRLRVMLVLDKQTNQAIYATADLLFSVTNINSCQSPLNLDNQFRFRVLYDKTFDVSQNGPQGRVIKIYKKVSTKLRFDASTPSIADLRSSSYSLVLISSEATNVPTVAINARLRFVDN